ncbi:MAG: FMN-binding protein [Oscillospiraceae bacterium]|nr:FMN-binding protein [Oscillospiraceae bacterium]
MRQDKKAPAESTAEFLRPVLVLSAICLAASALLGLTNSLTAPIIEAAELAEADRTRRELLPEAEEFEEIEIELEGIDSVYADTGGEGYVISVTGRGYKGDVPVTVGLDSEGVIVGVSADASGETATVGSRAGEAAFTDGFKGQSGSAEVDVLTGASVSSRAVINAVNQALAAYEEVKEGSV